MREGASRFLVACRVLFFGTKVVFVRTEKATDCLQQRHLEGRVEIYWRVLTRHRCHTGRDKAVGRAGTAFSQWQSPIYSTTLGANLDGPPASQSGSFPDRLPSNDTSPVTNHQGSCAERVLLLQNVVAILVYCVIGHQQHQTSTAARYEVVKVLARSRSGRTLQAWAQEIQKGNQKCRDFKGRKRIDPSL